MSPAIAVIVASSAILCIAMTVLLPMPQRQPVRLGLVGSLSGRFAALGYTGRDGALLAVEEINADGGIGGRRLELDIHDDRGDGEACIAAYRALAAGGCRIVVGPFATGPATAAADTIEQLGMLTLSPTVAGDNFTGRDDRFLRLYPGTRAMGAQLGRMAQADGHAALLVLGDQANGPFVATTVEGLRQCPGLAVTLREFDSRRPGSLDAALAETAPAAVLLVASSLDSAVAAQRLRQRRDDVALYCSSWAVSHELIANGGRAVDGLRTVLPVAIGGADALELDRRHRQRFGEGASHVAILHHLAVHLLAAAMRRHGDDPDRLRAALTSGQPIPDAPTGCALDRHGDSLLRLHPHRIVDGRLVAESAGRP